MHSTEILQLEIYNESLSNSVGLQPQPTVFGILFRAAAH